MYRDIVLTRFLLRCSFEGMFQLLRVCQLV
jgi:hypothetical protein